jgi:hypothetical protein
MHTKPGYNIKKFILVLIPAIICFTQVFAQENDGIYSSFSQTDTSFTFYGQFNVVAETNCLINICFNYKHIKALAVDASNVKLIEEGSNWNKIRYTYQIFPFFKNESLWYRTIDRKNSRVDFWLISSKNNNSVMPRIISSSGYYKVNRHNGIITVKYFQMCRLTSSFLTDLYLDLMKKKAIEFLHTFKDYSQKHCSNID